MERNFFIPSNNLTKYIFMWSAIMFSQIVSWWTYPLKQVGIPELKCKWIHRSNLESKCKMDLPIIKNAEYDKFNKNPHYRAIYSDIWWWGYTDGWDVLIWWSPWIDVATNEWTPVYAIWDWEVIQARELAGYGKSITVKHIVDGKAYYSSYSHLSKIEVKEWDKIKEGDKIWEVWKTWFTMWPYGYHLDFSISDASMRVYPYGYADCKAWYMNAVNNGACRDLLFKNTIDPIAFIEFQWDNDKLYAYEQWVITASKVLKENNIAASVKPVQQNAIFQKITTEAKPEVVKKSPTKRIIWKEVTTMDIDMDKMEDIKTKLANNNPAPSKDTSINNPVKVDVAKKVEQPQAPIVNTSPSKDNKIEYNTEDIYKFRDGDLEIKIIGLHQDAGAFIKNGVVYQVKTIVNKVSGKDIWPYDGKLPKSITFKSANKLLVAPYNYNIISKGIMLMDLYPAAPGTESLQVYYGDKLLGTRKEIIK